MPNYHSKKQGSSTSVQLAPKLGAHQKNLLLSSTEQGLTLIEGLLAIVIISITVVSISPPIFWAVATRVQTQRAEQSLKLAQGEIDRVRTLVERNEVKAAQFNLLPPYLTGTTESDVRNQTSGKFPAAPNAQASGAKVVSIRDCGTGTNGNDDTTLNGTSSRPVNAFIRIDTNGDCRADYLMQTFRSQGLDQDGNLFQGNANQILSAFVMGVRVYAAVAEPVLIGGKGKTEPAALRATNGLGNQLDRPLAVLYSTIVRSTDGRNLELYHKLCQPQAGSNTGAC
jgi:type II secretory pathway pseudopilin PulG